MEVAKSELREARVASPRPERLPAAPPADPNPVDEEVIADLTHEIRNHFHKLYYCAEILRANDAEPMDGPGAPGEMLERTLQNLEEFIGGALDYFRPVRLECIEMTAGDLASALEGVLREVAEDVPVRVTLVPGAQTARVAIDPGRFSAALRRAARLLTSAGRSAAQTFGLEGRVRLARRPTGEALEIKLEVAGSLGAQAPEKRHELVEWATIAKTLVAHGGGLVRGNTAVQAGPGCALWLPLCESDLARRS